MVATYTANLAQLLVVDAQSTTGRTGVKDCDPPSDKCQKVRIVQQQLNLVKVTFAGISWGAWGAWREVNVKQWWFRRARSDFQKAMCANGFHLVGDAMFTVYVGFAGPELLHPDCGVPGQLCCCI